MKKILFIAGTRPEAIKLSPVYLEAKRREGLDAVFCATGQHADLMGSALEVFGVKPDVTANTMEAGQGLPSLVSNLFAEVGRIIRDVKPDYVMVQGDTVSAFTGGWCGFYDRVRVLHLEAGLRTGDLEHPFPEEAIRRSLSIISGRHFAPTGAARDNLLRENVPADSIFVTGNTAIDALFRVKAEMDAEVGSKAGGVMEEDKRRIVVTGHRRENFGAGMEGLCEALGWLAKNYGDVDITYAVHPNPAVREPVERMLGGLPNIHLIAPLGYRDFIRLMSTCHFLISDSGGVQEEAPALGKPVLVTRRTTERPEAAERGATRLVGCEADSIIAAARELLDDPAAYTKMARAGCPYGDGGASVRICDWLEDGRMREFGG